MAETSTNQQGGIPEFHCLVGEAIRAWANVEGQLWLFVSMILGIDQFRARIVMGSIPGARAKREFVSRLAETYLDPSLLPKLRKLLARLKKLGRTRNILAHSLIHINVDGNKNVAFADVFSDEMDGGLDFDTYPLPPNDVRMLVQALQTLQKELTEFIVECDGRVLTDARVHREDAEAKMQAGDGSDQPGV